MLFAFAFRSIPFGNNFLNWLSNNITLNAASAFLFRVSHSSDDGFPSACQMRPQHEADNSNRNGNHHRDQHGKSSVLVFVSLPSVPYEDRGPRAGGNEPYKETPPPFSFLFIILLTRKLVLQTWSPRGCRPGWLGAVGQNANVPCRGAVAPTSFS